MNDWLVYIVRCSDNSLYTGITTDVHRRIEKHNSGKGAKYTASRGPVELVVCKGMFNKSKASQIESTIKKLNKKDKITYLKGV